MWWNHFGLSFDIFSSQPRGMKDKAPFEISCQPSALVIVISAPKFANLANVVTSIQSPPLCFRSGRLISVRRIVPMYLPATVGLIRRGARFDKSGRGAGWVVLKWKFCQLQSGLQEGAAAPSDDLRPRPLQWWRVRQSGTAGESSSNRRAAVILRNAAIFAID